MAVDRNPDVMEMVEEALRENPDVSNEVLQERAAEIDSSVGELDARSFNARYPLQVKRKLSAESQASANGGSAESEESAEPEEAEEQDEAPSDEDTKEQVFSMIEKALRENPDVSNEVLQERAAEIDSSIADLPSRSFHARYPLQVKRQMSAEQKEEAEEEEKVSESAERDELRDELRQTLIDFAKDVAGAEDRGQVIEVLTSVDEYVDRIVSNA